MASRMESHGVACMTHLSCAAYERLRRPEESRARSRGSIEIKGLGAMDTYLVPGIDDADALAAAVAAAARRLARAPRSRL